MVLETRIGHLIITIIIIIIIMIIIIAELHAREARAWAEPHC